MKGVVGVFALTENAIGAVRSVVEAGTEPERINLLAPQSSAAALTRTPTTDAEPLGVGTTLGAVVGGAAGGALGLGLGAAASAAVPGVGQVVFMGVLATLLASGGGIGGASVGGSLENATEEGIAKDELFVYRDALRSGRIVIIVTSGDAEEIGRVRALFEEAGAESVDAARQAWWLGLRDAAAEEYEAR